MTLSSAESGSLTSEREGHSIPGRGVAAVLVPLLRSSVTESWLLLMGEKGDCTVTVATPYRAGLSMRGSHKFAITAFSVLVLVVVTACIASSNEVNSSTLYDDTPQASARRFLFSHSHNAIQEAWLAKKRDSLVNSPYSSMTQHQLVDRSQFSSAHMTNILSSGGDGTMTRDNTSNVGSAMRLALDSSLKRDIKNKYTLEKSNMARVLALVKKIPLSLPSDTLEDPNVGVATIPTVRPLL